jgi:hypothetical protein
MMKAAMRAPTIIKAIKLIVGEIIDEIVIENVY